MTTELISQQQDKRKLPDGWRWVKLGDIADTCSGTTPSRDCDNYYQGSIPWVKTGELQDNVIYDSEEHISEAALRETSLKLLPVGTLLVAMYGQGKTRGRTGLLAIPATTNQACFAILPNPEEFDSHYLQWWFRHSYSRLRRETEGRGGNQPNLNGDVLRNQQLLFPPLDEQKRIVAILNEQMEAVERSRQATLAQLEAAKVLPAAYLRAVFNSPEAQKWERKQLGELAQFKNGINFTGDQKGQGTLTVDVLNMYSDSVYIQMDKLYRVDIRISDEYLLHPQDILFVRSSVKEEGVAWSACFSEYTEPITFCGFLIRARLIEANIHPEFLIYYLRQDSLRSLLISKSGRGTITNINQENLKTVTVPTPPLAVQKRIAATLTEQLAEVEHLQKSLKYQLDAINKLPATLLHRAFNGEL